MRSTNSKKILALLSFVTLITAFVLYRAGVFDKYINSGDPSFQSSPNGGAMNNNQADTLPQKKRDSIPLVKNDSIKIDPIMWSGSKSGKIISPADIKLLLPDSTKPVDSFQLKRIDSIMKSQRVKTTVVMPSSKSGPVFVPKQKEDNELMRIIKIYQGDSAGLRRALERYFKVRN